VADTLPWFPFYVDRFLGSRKTRTMTAEQVGIYLLLLCEQWDHGAIPDVPAELEDIARAPHSQAMAVLQRCFELKDGMWINAPLEEIRTEQETKSERFAEAGRRGAAKRWGNKTSRPGHRVAMRGYSIREEEIREEENRVTTSARGNVEKSKAKKKTQIPDDWAPNDGHRKRAKEDGTDVEREAEKFRAHHQARGTTFVRWDQAFTTWLINAPEFRAKTSGNRPPPDSEAAEWDAEAVRAKEARALARAHEEREIKRLSTEHLSLTAGPTTKTPTGKSRPDEAA